MKHFKGLLLHEYLLIKPFLIIAVIVNVLCFAAVLTAALILKYAVGVYEYSNTMMVVIAAIILPVAFNIIPTVVVGLRYENDIAKRNRFSFSLPVSRFETVLSRVFIPSCLFFACFFLVPVSVNLYRRILGFEELFEMIAVSYLMVFAFSLMFGVFLTVMFMSAKELLLTALSFGGLMFLLGRSGPVWRRLFDGVNFESDSFYSAIINNYGLGVLISLCAYIAALAISYGLAGRRDKLCQA